MKIRSLNVNHLFQLAIGSTLVLLGSVSEVLAGVNDSAYSVSNWTTEGNGKCADYYDNAVILEARTSILDGGIAVGPDSPEDDDILDEEVTVTINAADNTRIDFHSTTSTYIDAVILKNSRDIAVFIEPAGGVIRDLSVGFQDGTPISTVAFCYGLPSEPTPLGGEPLPLCGSDSDDGDPNNAADPDNMGDADGCESGEDFECDLVVNDGVGPTVDCCACGDEVLAECNPLMSGDCNILFQSLTEIIFGENGKWICFQTDSGEKCYRK